MHDIPEISLDDAKKRHEAGDAIFLDIRDPASFASARIRGARHIADPSQMDEFIDQTNPEHPIIVYCYHGNSSLGGVGYLMDNGFTNVFSMREGFEGWRRVFDHESS